MKFSELPESSKDRAREALCAVIRNGVNSASEKLAGETVATAFIAMEHHDDAPEMSDDGEKGRGQDYEKPPKSDQDY